MSIHNARFVATVLVAMVFPLTSALADTIAVDNPSFETLPPGGLTIACSDPSGGCRYSSGAIPGWSTSLSSGTSGQFQPGPPTNTTYYNTVPDGITIAYIDGVGTISQVVLPAVQLGVTYTLNVDLGFDKPPTAAFDGEADLLVNGVRYPAIGIPPSRGNWSNYTATYLGLAADVGQSITIELVSSGTEGAFDNVRLTDSVTSVPEPSSALLFLLPALFVLVRRRTGAAAGQPVRR